MTDRRPPFPWIYDHAFPFPDYGVVYLPGYVFNWEVWGPGASFESAFWKFYICDEYEFPEVEFERERIDDPDFPGLDLFRPLNQTPGVL